MNDMLATKFIETPVGKMQAIASANGLCALEFVKEDRQKLLDNRLSRWFSFEQLRSVENGYIEEAVLWIDNYFSGRIHQLSRISLDLRGTPFELRVWDELQKIPFGKTISYSDLAATVGIPKAPRAAGGASRRNPMSILIPCHRVIGLRGDLTGYGGGLDQKARLISHEASYVLDPDSPSLEESVYG
jgi:O-6-methylguanine DNA methyltransferase